VSQRINTYANYQDEQKRLRKELFKINVSALDRQLASQEKKKREQVVVKNT
jgi:hypothetical protein